MSDKLTGTKIANILCAQHNYQHFISLLPMQCIKPDRRYDTYMSRVPSSMNFNARFAVPAQYMIGLLATFVSRTTGTWPVNEQLPMTASRARQLLAMRMRSLTSGPGDIERIESIIASCNVKQLCSVPDVFYFCVEFSINIAMRLNRLPMWFGDIAYGIVRLEHTNKACTGAVPIAMTVAQYVLEQSHESWLPSSVFAPYSDVLAQDNARIIATIALRSETTSARNGRIEFLYELRPFTAAEFNEACSHVMVQSFVCPLLLRGLSEIMDPANEHDIVLQHMRRIIRTDDMSEIKWQLRCMFPRTMYTDEAESEYVWSCVFTAIVCESDSLSDHTRRSIDASIAKDLAESKWLLRNKTRCALWIDRACENGLISTAVCLIIASTHRSILVTPRLARLFGDATHTLCPAAMTALVESLANDMYIITAEMACDCECFRDTYALGTSCLLGADIDRFIVHSLVRLANRMDSPVDKIRNNAHELIHTFVIERSTNTAFRMLSGNDQQAVRYAINNNDAKN